MMRLLICSGMGESEWCTNHALIWAFRQLGCKVVSCGPRYNNQGYADIEVADKPFPETWTYREILDLCPWTPDFILQIVPHFYLTGEKPKGIKSGFYCTDQHATGIMFKQGAEWGNFDYLFIGQPAYRHFFVGLAPIVENLLPAFDERRFKSEIETKPKFQISFVGMSGLALTRDHWDNPDGEDEAGKYITNLKGRLPNDMRKYDSRMPSYDYATRAELLYRLSQDFSVRICESLWDTRIQGAIQSGQVGFNRSLLNDLSIRNFEVAASRRSLVTDNVRELGYLDPLCYPLATYFYESGLYQPFYSHFDLEYAGCRKAVEKALKASGDRIFALESQDHVFAHHTWRNRAQEIIAAIRII